MGQEKKEKKKKKKDSKRERREQSKEESVEDNDPIVKEPVAKYESRANEESEDEKPRVLDAENEIENDAKSSKKHKKHKKEKKEKKHKKEKKNEKAEKVENGEIEVEFREEPGAETVEKSCSELPVICEENLAVESGNLASGHLSNSVEADFEEEDELDEHPMICNIVSNRNPNGMPSKLSLRGELANSAPPSTSINTPSTSHILSTKSSADGKASSKTISLVTVSNHGWTQFSVFADKFAPLGFL